MITNRNNNIIAILISALMIIAMIPLVTETAFADSLQPSGSCGDNATYEFNSETGDLTISGTGGISASAFEGMSDKDTIKSITIGEGITSIGSNAFAGATGCDEVNLPNGLISIGAEAFYNCFALSSVDLPDSLESIGEAAFYNDNLIKTVVIPANVSEFYWDAFGRESGDLEKITIKSDVITIKQRSDNKTYKCPSSIISAGPIGGNYDYEFSWTTKIPGRAFSEIGSGISNNSNSLESVTIPDTVTEIGECAFYKAKKIESVDLPDGLTTIGEYCFAETGIRSINIPEGVTAVPDYAFYNCASLNTLPVTDHMTEIGYAAFNGCTSLGTITIPASVKTIKGDAFYACGLTEVSILNPACVITDDENVFNNNGSKPTIKGYDESTAQAYAQKYGYTFESLGPAPDTTIPVVNLKSIKKTIPEGRTKAFTGDKVILSVEVTDNIGVLDVNFAVLQPESSATPAYKADYKGSDPVTNSGLWEAEVDVDELGEWKPYMIIASDVSGNQSFYWDPTAIPIPYSFPETDLSTLRFEAIPPCDPHAWEQKIQKATPTANGRIYQVCSACGAEENIAPLLKVSNIKLSKTTFVFTGKAITPKVTVANASETLSADNYTVKYSNNVKVGKATATVTLKGAYYEGSKTLSFKIIPKKAVISKAAPGKKSVKVTMKTKPAAKGGTTYQIQYRIKGKSKWKTTSTTGKTKTIKKLQKGKRYQIRVRAFKKVSDTTYYGAWSKITTTKKVK